MHIALSGGNGRIGRAVLELALSQGHSVVNIDRTPPEQNTTRPGVTQAEVDITDYHQLEQALSGCEALIHLAAIPSPISHPDYVVHNNNVVGSYNALSAAARLGIRRVCQASSINAIGASFSRSPRYDYFPLDEHHPSYNEDAYSLSKWICEQQADSFARREESMSVASLRFHWVVPDRDVVARRQAERGQRFSKNLWGYTWLDAAARACLLSLTADFSGHEVFYIVAPDTTIDVPSLELKAQFFPHVPLRGDLSGNRGFFNCQKAERLLGWKHNTEKTTRTGAHHDE
jgi:nucleoside-diphosphate-sugar epimerase